MSIIAHYDFDRKIEHFVIEIEDGLGVGYKRLAVDRQQLMHGLDFVREHAQVFAKISPKGRPSDGLLRGTASGRCFWRQLDILGNSGDVLGRTGAPGPATLSNVSCRPYPSKLVANWRSACAVGVGRPGNRQRNSRSVNTTDELLR